MLIACSGFKSPGVSRFASTGTRHARQTTSVQASPRDVFVVLRHIYTPSKSDTPTKTKKARHLKVKAHSVGAFPRRLPSPMKKRTGISCSSPRRICSHRQQQGVVQAGDCEEANNWSDGPKPLSEDEKKALIREMVRANILSEVRVP